jgi:glyoxylase-like metal-dependent hydrolase (beta-lactamase superfamily II)
MKLKNVARNVWQLYDLLPNSINAYLVDDVLIDTGTRLARRSFIQALFGIDLKLVALTHCHPDHQGSAKAICEFFSCDLACHEADRAAMEGREPMGPPTWPIRISSNLMAGPPHPVARMLREGDEIAGFRVIETPGHTFGHISLFREEDRLAIIGDVMTNMNLVLLVPGLHEPPGFFCVDSTLNRKSIRKVVDLKPDTVLFGHGPPLRDGRQLQAFADRLPA